MDCRGNCGNNKTRVFKFLRRSVDGAQDSTLPITPVVIPTLRPVKEARKE